MEQQTTQELKGLEIEAEHAAAFRGVFVETAYTAEEIKRSKAAEKRMGLDKLPCAFLSSIDS